MDNEAFYATTAQVLPTILIALAVEANLLIWRQRKPLEDAHRSLVTMYEDALDRYGHARATSKPDALTAAMRASFEQQIREMNKSTFDMQRRIFARHQAALERQRTGAIVTGVLFLIGEVAAILGLLFDPSKPFPGTEGTSLGAVIAPIAAAALVALSVLAVLLPTLRMPKHDDLKVPRWRAWDTAPTRLGPGSVPPPDAD